MCVSFSCMDPGSRGGVDGHIGYWRSRRTAFAYNVRSSKSGSQHAIPKIRDVSV